MRESISFKELLKMAEEDTEFNPKDIETIIAKISSNRQKWVNILSSETIRYKSVLQKYSKLYRQRWHYYRFEYDFELKTKDELSVYINADEQVQALQAKKEVYEEKIEFIEATIKTLDGLSFNVKHYIEYMKFTAGF